jgi:hypothetical protein
MGVRGCDEIEVGGEVVGGRGKRRPYERLRDGLVVVDVAA